MLDKWVAFYEICLVANIFCVEPFLIYFKVLIYILIIVNLLPLVSQINPTRIYHPYDLPAALPRSIGRLEIIYENMNYNK